MLRMDTPALAKGGYTLGLAPIAFQYKGSSPRTVYPPFSRAGDQPPGWWWVSSRKAAFPFRSICPWQMLSFGR